MFLVANVLSACATILHKVLELYGLVVVVTVLISWVHPDPFNPIVRFLRSVTEPAFEWIRRRIPFAMVGMLDLSPMILLLFIWFVQLAAIPSLYDLAAHWR
ncbi:MAG: YggT family protein [Candidatus Omnitrophica bacterium]|nr:YggT family protein [Candidatus Omnitrophota bacterium]